MNYLHFITYSENNISEKCQGASLSRLRGPGKGVMIDGTLTLEKSFSFDYDTSNGSKVKNQKSICMWLNYISTYTYNSIPGELNEKRQNFKAFRRK